MTRQFQDALRSGAKFGLVSPGGALHGARLAGMLYAFARHGYLENAIYELAISASVWNLFFAHTPLEVMLRGIGIYPYHCTSLEFRPRLSLNINFDYLENVVKEIIRPGLSQLQEALPKIFVGLTNTATGEGQVLCANEVPDAFRLGSASSRMTGRPIEILGSHYIDGGYYFTQTDLVRRAIQAFPAVEHLVVLVPQVSGLEQRMRKPERMLFWALTANGTRSLAKIVRTRQQRMLENMRFLEPYLSHKKFPHVHIFTPGGPAISKVERDETKVIRAIGESANKVLEFLGHDRENLIFPR